jgi:drug/metabolite transporter (DMT)-like permease
VGELIGVLIAIVSSCLGGTAAAVTRYLVGNADALTLTILRWGIGFLFVLPIALALRVKWPQRSDWFGVAALGLCFSACSSFSIISRSATRRPRAPVSRCRPCRCRPCWSADFSGSNR